jgi:hypothetical protein
VNDFRTSGSNRAETEPSIGANLIALRNAHKGNPAIGTHCNLLLKQLDNHKTADPESRPMLAGLIRQTMTELSNLLPKGV